MKNNFKPILIALLIVIFLSAILVFLYRENIWDYLTVEAETGLVDITYSAKILTSDTIDVELLKSPVLSSLENQVVNFNYEDVCSRPKIVLQTSEGAVVNQATECIVGNKLPFASEEK